jgi:hypothetical protein
MFRFNKIIFKCMFSHSTATDLSQESLHTIRCLVVLRERQINTTNCIHSSEDYMIKRQNTRWPIASMQEMAKNTSLSV